MLANSSCWVDMSRCCRACLCCSELLLLTSMALSDTQEPKPNVSCQFPLHTPRHTAQFTPTKTRQPSAALHPTFKESASMHSAFSLHPDSRQHLTGLTCCTGPLALVMWLQPTSTTHSNCHLWIWESGFHTVQNIISHEWKGLRIVCRLESVPMARCHRG